MNKTHKNRQKNKYIYNNIANITNIIKFSSYETIIVII